jgi:hypothetical protein
LSAASCWSTGYDISRQRSKSIVDLPDIEFDFVATMGCGDACPFVRAKHREDWDIPDPKPLPRKNFAPFAISLEAKSKLCSRHWIEHLRSEGGTRSPLRVVTIQAAKPQLFGIVRRLVRLVGSASRQAFRGY